MHLNNYAVKCIRTHQDMGWEIVFRSLGGYPCLPNTEGDGGGRGIRTPGTRKGSTVFKTAALNHSAIPPFTMVARVCGRAGRSKRKKVAGICITRYPRGKTRSREMARRLVTDEPLLLTSQRHLRHGQVSNDFVLLYL